MNEKANSSPAAYQPTVQITTSKQDHQFFIQVKDNGARIPDNIIDKIFQPFFTTRPTGQATGLGLSLSYDIVKANGGEILVSGNSVGGAMFTVVLPCDGEAS